MPRVDNLGSNVSEWYDSPKAKGNGSSTHDVCMRCYKRLKSDPHIYNFQLKPYNGDPLGIDGWGGDVCHPPYEEENCTCAVCDCKLKKRDNDGWE